MAWCFLGGWLCIRVSKVFQTHSIQKGTHSLACLCLSLGKFSQIFGPFEVFCYLIPILEFFEIILMTKIINLILLNSKPNYYILESGSNLCSRPVHVVLLFSSTWLTIALSMSELGPSQSRGTAVQRRTTNPSNLLSPILLSAYCPIIFSLLFIHLLLPSLVPCLLFKQAPSPSSPLISWNFQGLSLGQAVKLRHGLKFHYGGSARLLHQTMHGITGTSLTTRPVPSSASRTISVDTAFFPVFRLKWWVNSFALPTYLFF